MGGDEFVVLVERPGDEHSLAAELSRCAQTALAAVRRPIRLGSHSIVVSASVGRGAARRRRAPGRPS